MNQENQRLILRDDRIIETVAQLQARINDRFPGSGLANLCGQLLDVAKQASKRSALISRPIFWIRLLGYLVVAMLLSMLGGFAAFELQVAKAEDVAALELITILEAGSNVLVLIGIATYFLVSLETRIKRRRALSAIHELRSIAHVIDMHQLTKDPERFLRTWSDAEHSPKHKMTPFELNRYLDYCSEMLSLTGKIAATYIQHFEDADAVNAVSEVEQLTSNLSGKIWQKIMATHDIAQWNDEQAAATPVVNPTPAIEPNPTAPEPSNK